VIFLRHFKFFTEPTPFFIGLVEKLDSFFQVGLPIFFLTDGALVAAAGFLLLRRLLAPQVRYISLINDYFPLILILGIALTGITMRYFIKVDLLGVKALAVGLFSFAPATPQGLGSLFYAHLFLVCCLIAYFPFSKLMHLGGVFMSPMRNLANNNRANMHVNPWNYPVEVHSYQEWEEEFKPKLKSAGIPLDEE
jgi:nitrate reductase gamma subunit